MKTFLLLGFSAFLCAYFIHSKTSSSPAVYSVNKIQDQQQKKKLFSFGCSPDLSFLTLDEDASNIPLLPGWGNYRMPVTVTNDSAKIYFEQGINMYYGFHIIEALASFDRSVQFDGNFAMGYWGKALAYGPNINDFGYSASPDALAAIQKAQELSANCTRVEKAMIAAMQIRYSADTTQTREYLNQLYADAMKKVHKDFPQSADAAALYTDALMVQHPWDLYDKYYKPKPWTPIIVSTLEAVVKQFPNHPGACHYYIHAIEGSEFPEKGLAVANRLGAMMPGLAHLVHMPSHIYIRTGYYAKGVTVNTDAINSYNDALNRYPAVVNNNFLYLIHNAHLQTACAEMDGNFSQSAKISNDCRNSIDASYISAPGFFGMYAQYAYMTPVFTLIRFGKWEEMLNTPAIADSLPYANLLWHFGRGLAFARTHDIPNANKELEMLRANMDNPQLQDHPPAFNPGIDGAGVAEKILQGVIAEESNDLDGAIDILQDARDREDNMLYAEPKDWLLPARQYLGEVLLKAKQYKAAEVAYRRDLELNPRNGWSLTGLALALQKQGKKSEANTVKAQAAKSFERSDLSIKNSVF